MAVLMLLPLSSFEAATTLAGAAVQPTRSRMAARRLVDLVGPHKINAATRPQPVPAVGRPGALAATDVVCGQSSNQPWDRST